MPDILNEFSIFAPAKINLHLKVLDRRKDGFHNIESLFLKLDFGDFLRFELNKNDNTIEIVMKSEFFTTNGTYGSFTNSNLRFAHERRGRINDEDNISFPIPHSPFPIKDNIINKTVSLFKELTDFDKGLKIIVDKRIPIGGGLGGGSSDAASTLHALNKITDSPLNSDSLLEAAASLGSDVPFFMSDTTAAWVTGRGEIIEPVDVPKMFIVLVNPGFPSDTASAFQLLDSQRSIRNFNHKPHKPHELELRNLSSVREPQPNPKGEGSPLDGSWWFVADNLKYFHNDFFEVFPEKVKLVYKDIISELQKQGAVYANLSGSGSTCFGVFESEEQAHKAEESLINKWELVKRCRSFIVSS